MNRCMPMAMGVVMIYFLTNLSYPQIPITISGTIPSSVNNAAKQFFRPIFEQQGESCGNASGIGYNFTYEIDCQRALSAGVAANQYPYIYTYAFLNDGNENIGNSHMYVDALNIVKENGIPNAVDWGGFNTGFPTKWMSGYDLYYKAMYNRVDRIDTISVLDSAGLRRLKQWLYNHGNGSANGGVANLGCSVNSWQFSKIASGPESGKSICIRYGTDISGDHGQTIIGYNDSIRYDFNKDGKFSNNLDANSDGAVTMADWEIGALRIANSWGVNSGIGDSDIYWLPYRILAMPQTGGGIGNGNRVCIATVKQNYAPGKALKISLTHSQRNQIALSVGVAPTRQAAQPTKVRAFARQFTYAGGAFPLCGSGGSSTMEIGLDVSDLADSIAGSNSATYFLIVQSKNGGGTVNSVSLMDYASATAIETKAAQTNTAISANAKLYIGVSSGISEISPRSGERRETQHAAFALRRVGGGVQIRAPRQAVCKARVFSVNGSLLNK